jgi:type III secretory pathway lipoprotein EscJ
MSLAMVQVAVAGDVDDAEEMQAVLVAAGIEPELQAGQDDSVRVLVPEADLVSAQEALEALGAPDDLVAEP